MRDAFALALINLGLKALTKQGAVKFYSDILAEIRKTCFVIPFSSRKEHEMPCRSDYMEPTPGEKAASKEIRELFEGIGNKACHYSDVLREYLIGNAELEDIVEYVNHDLDGEYLRAAPKLSGLYVGVDPSVPAKTNELVQQYTDLNELVLQGRHNLEPEIKEKLEFEQQQHREADLVRLMKTFGASADREKLLKVLKADATKPLQVQLGFDPDDF